MLGYLNLLFLFSALACLIPERQFKQLLQEGFFRLASHLVRIKYLLRHEALEGRHAVVRVQLQHAFHDGTEWFAVFCAELGRHLPCAQLDGCLLRLHFIFLVSDGRLELANVRHGVLTREEAQVARLLLPEVLENDQVLVVLADDVHLVFRALLCLLLFVDLIARRQREARVTLIQVA